MPRQDHEDLKSSESLKRQEPRRPPLAEVVLDLKQFIRETYQDVISCEDARDFTLGIQERFEAKIRSWGETPQTSEEYLEAQRAAGERAKDEADFERLRKKLGR